MLVYRDASRTESTEAKVDRLRRLAAARDTLGFLVEIGELEQGVVDALHPVTDGLSRQGIRLRTATRTAAAAFLAARTAHPVEAELRRAETLLEALCQGPLPTTIRVRPPEGYVHYALDPGGYAAAAAAYRVRAGAARSARAVVIGIRSIGTSLSAVVAAELGAQRSFTLRPRGETGHRHVAVDRALTRCLLRWASDAVDILIVDEGPGATGETFEAVAAWVRCVGIDDDRIVLIPSRAWGMPLAAETRRLWFAAARKFTPPHEDDRAARIARRHGLPPPRDLSAGRWRSVVSGGGAEPARVAHERVKFLAGSIDDPDTRLIRYVGLGRWGDETVERAIRLADAGIGPPVLGVDTGFLLCAWRPGRPVSRAARVDGDLLAALARYLATRVRLLATGRTADRAPLVSMLVHNATEALGGDAAGLGVAARRLERLPPAEAVVPDARMQPREWIRARDGYVKVDAVDHGAGLRLPGPTDAAWDLAAAAVEFRIADAALARLVRRVGDAAGRDAAELRRAVLAHRPAYTALAFADAALSAREATSAEDRRRLEAEAGWYRAALRHELERTGSLAA